MKGERGVSLIVVLWIVMVLSLLIGGFAFTMHVETQVAAVSRKELKASLLARSGVEVARMQLLLHLKTPNETEFEALNQSWETNTELLVDHELGDGRFTARIVDEERKLPLNKLTEDQWRDLLDGLAVDPTETATIVDSIMDWLDDNDEHRLNGVESEYYAHLPVPYRAKNGPCDRVEELLLVRGITRRLFDGGTTNDVARPGFCELLTTAPSGRVNVNTASAPVLQIMFDLDEAGAAAVVARRDGPDGVAGTSDDQPYRNVAAFISEVGGSDPALQRLWSQRATVRSATFVVTATGEVAGIRRTITARLQRQNQDFLVTGWVERRGGP